MDNVYTLDEYKETVKKKLSVIDNSTDKEEIRWAAVKISELASLYYQKNYKFISLDDKIHREYIHFVLLLQSSSESLYYMYGTDNYDLFKKFLKDSLNNMIDFFERTISYIIKK